MSDKQKTARLKPSIVNIFKRIHYQEDILVLNGLCLIRVSNATEPLDTEDVRIDTLTRKNVGNINFKFRHGLKLAKGWRLNLYSLTFKLNELLHFDIQNKIVVNYKDEYDGNMIYSFWETNINKGHGKTSRIVRKDGMSVYFRQTNANTTYLTVRPENIYDKKTSALKILAADFCAKFIHKDIILLYEKESSQYEESAAVLYERLRDMGYENVYFLLNKDNPKICEMLPKYKKNIVIKDSFRHLVYFFLCKKFIGTETLWHSIQLRAANRLIIKKVLSKDISYVFLQHGVMYMVSLNAESRAGFRQQNLRLYRIVTSSKAEAKHFIELGGFRPEEIYITGLAKFDRSYREKSADKIIIMPTWRRWESNVAMQNFADTKYYQMMSRMVNAIPETYADKIIVLPHPLMRKAMESSNCELKKYMQSNCSYDEVLRQCDTLITDYSSIAYDAFYRGSNVIFYWQEKKDCLKHYGKDSQIMLNEENVFGDICYYEADLTRAVERNYRKPQCELYKQRYKAIVEFDDNKNTDRLIQALKADGLL